MKHLKLSLLLVTIFYLLGCETAINQEKQSEVNAESEEMSITEASIDAVLSFVKEVYPQKYKTLSLTKETLQPEFVTNASYERNKFFAPSTDNTNKEIDTLLSVINFGNDEGFAIVSTKDNQVLAVTESGNLSAEELTMDYSEEDFENNPKALISNYIANYTSSLPTIPVGPIGPITPPIGPMDPIDSIDMGHMIRGPWETETETQINPLIKINLHQKSPYNKFCIGSQGYPIATGCVTIAVMHIMSANRYPDSIGTTKYNWDTIIEEYRINSTVRDTLAKWIQIIGEKCGIVYESDTVSSTIYKAKNCLSLYTGYKNLKIIENPSYEDVSYMIKKRTPLYFRGARMNNGERGAHAWVIDGIVNQKQVVKLYNSNDNLIGEYYETRGLVHCNWGWEGSLCNGYYAMNIFNLNNGAIIPDKTTSSDSKDCYYNLDIKAITYDLVIE